MTNTECKIFMRKTLKFGIFKIYSAFFINFTLLIKVT